MNDSSKISLSLKPLRLDISTNRYKGLKVPKMTIYFWIIKILTTAMGEATSDFLNLKLGPVIAVPIMLIVLSAALKMQFKQENYKPSAYWFVVVMVSVFGTTAADALHVVLSIPYVISTCFYLIVVVVLFIFWHRTEKSLSIHSIYTPRREAFYWATVLAAFALGTAAGDMTATTLGWGYFLSGIIFSAIFIVPAFAYKLFNLNSILAFWLSYITTRPLGASFADWSDASHRNGGLAISAWAVSLGLTFIIFCFVLFLEVSGKDIPDIKT
jgi:uncharacterized membrane-anchored protein